MKVEHSGGARPRREGESCDDAWAVSEGHGALIAALADGVGASREGGVAARRAVEMLTDHGVARPRAWSARRALAEFTGQINRQLHQEAIERHGSPELACTLSAVVLEGGRLYGCNVGDSPVFHWREGKLRRLSESHSLAEPGMHHVLTRAIGLEPHAEPYFFELDLADGDQVLLCSDGVATALDETQIAVLLGRRAAARAIVSEACAAAEREELQDDTSAIVLDVIERGRPAGADAQRLEVLPALRAGEVVDGHRLVRSLAVSERVWLAEDGAGGSLVLKFPALEAAESEGLRDAFVREAWNATRLVSADLVRAWTPAEGALRYYAMEFVPAPTLRQVLEGRGVLSVEEARDLGRFLLRAGQHLLRHELVHGDIKPENLLVLRNASAAGGGTTFKLLDFGSAAELFSVTSRAGTPSYLAPERFHGAAVAERTEIFAIGVTLYEALSGVYPYGEVERFQTPRFDASPRRLGKLNPAVPDWFESIVLRAIEPDRERRYQHFSEMAFELEQPAKVAPYHRKDAPLLERNPVRFYKLLCGVLVGVIGVLLGLLARG